MTQRILAVVAAAGLSAAALTVAAVPAQAVAAVPAQAVAAVPAQAVAAVPAQAVAAPLCTVTAVTPTTVVVGLSPLTRRFDVRTTGCTETGWDVLVGQDEYYAASDAPLVELAPESNAQAHRYSVYASAYNADGVATERTWSTGFALKRRTVVKAFDVSPEPAVRGRAMSVRGVLVRADWSTQSYRGLGGQPVAIQFRTPTGRYVTVKTVTTGSGGAIATSVVARTTGYWRAVYAGNAVSGRAVVAGDKVEVR